jgi:lipopolysaccharide transport system permease protein
MNQVDEQVGALTQTPAPMGSTVRPTDDRPLTRIDGRTTWSWNDVLEIWRFRELFYNLTLRDVKLRYKQTILGVGWSFFQPLATVMVFVLFVGVLGKARGDMGYGEYILYVMAGVIPWTFFASSVQNAGNSLLNNHNLVTKTYFPRLALPSANVFAALFDFGICLVMFAVAIVGFALFGQPVSVGPQLLLLPVVVLLLILLTLGLGVVFSALIAAQRDFRFLITFGIQLWMFATPCIYLPPGSYSDTTKMILMVNPVYGLIANFRACALGQPLDWLSFAVAAFLSIGIFLFAMVYFRRVDRTLADTI